MFANGQGTPPTPCGSGGSCSVCAPCLIIHLCRLSVKVAFIEAPRPRLSGRTARALCGPWAPGARFGLRLHGGGDGEARGAQAMGVAEEHRRDPPLLRMGSVGR